MNSTQELFDYYKKHPQLSFIKDFFRNCPETIIQYLRLLSYPANYKIIESATKCENVYFLMSGHLNTIEERVGQIPYRFCELSPVEIVGDYECFTQARYSYVTVLTSEPCELLVLPGKLYLNWMKKDAHALFIRTQLLMKQLSYQTQFDRQYMFMDYRTRCIMSLIHDCQKITPQNGIYSLSQKREELAAKLGCSLRTLQRILQEFKKEEKIQISGRSVILTQQQYQALLNEFHSYMGDTL